MRSIRVDTSSYLVHHKLARSNERGGILLLDLETDGSLRSTSLIFSILDIVKAQRKL